MRTGLLVLAAAMTAATASSPMPALADPIDAGLFTNYTAGATGVNLVVCGHLPNSSGCYGSSNLGPFEQACAVLEGASTKSGNVITRPIYILDKRTAKTDHIILYVYTRTDTITDQANDQIQVSLTQSVPLGLTGGEQSRCSMAANDGFVYAATTADKTTAVVTKADLSVAHFGKFSGGAHVVSITADDRGYVDLHFTRGAYTIDPNGQEASAGGSPADQVGTRNAWVPR
jgi:hypothetical protein